MPSLVAKARRLLDEYRSSLLEKADLPKNELIDRIAYTTNTSPTDAQKASGNYRKGKFRYRGLQFVIENPRGSTRSGVSPDGERWASPIFYHYGYIARTEGSDSDQIDFFLGPNIDEPIVYVIDQVDENGQFDETKSMVGFSSLESARVGYLSNYPAGWNGIGTITPVPFTAWKEWIMSDKAKESMSEQFRTEVDILSKEQVGDGPLYLYGAAWVPDKVDRQNHVIDADTIRKAARDYMINAQHAGLRHKWLLAKEGIQLTQSFIAPSDMQIGEKDIPKGSWVVEFRVTDDTLKKSITSGQFNAFSVGGRAKYADIEE